MGEGSNVKRKMLLKTLAAALLLALLTACLPQGGIFGHGDSVPRSEFAGSPLATVETARSDS